MSAIKLVWNLKKGDVHFAKNIMRDITIINTSNNRNIISSNNHNIIHQEITISIHRNQKVSI